MTASAEVWADAMLAAALLAVDPELGGAAVRAGPGPVRDNWLDGLKALHAEGTPCKRLPPGIGDDRLLGGLDLAAALGAGTRVLQKGILVEADGGVLIAPMAERLDGGVAAKLAGAIDEGAVRIERDGASERAVARFVLVALDEGLEDERPAEALLERLAFRIDLDGVGWREAQPISATPEDIAEAKAALVRVGAPDEAAIHAVCAACEALGVASLRAPRLTLRTAAALAALEGRDAIEAEDLTTAARLVLSPRATRLPPQSAPEDVEPEAEPDPAEAQGADETEASDRTPEVLDDLVLEAARAALPDGLEALWAASGQTVRGAPARSGPAGAKLPAAKRGRRIGSR
ncbi:MAG: hypothetical protein K2X61_03575, partial [Caulobacteraceae bacterium]|nr:hypothetical protein [Caulobacteraceae bacterium]